MRGCARRLHAVRRRSPASAGIPGGCSETGRWSARKPDSKQHQWEGQVAPRGRQLVTRSCVRHSHGICPKHLGGLQRIGMSPDGVAWTHGWSWPGTSSLRAEPPVLQLWRHPAGVRGRPGWRGSDQRASAGAGPDDRGRRRVPVVFPPTTRWKRPPSISRTGCAYVSRCPDLYMYERAACR